MQVFSFILSNISLTHPSRRIRSFIIAVNIYLLVIKGNFVILIISVASIPLSRSWTRSEDGDGLLSVLPVDVRTLKA